jgi:hypothetical protein
MTQIESLIREELAQAGETTSITPELLKLDDFRITSSTDVAEEEFLFRMFGTPCFPRCELTTITGLEKCGKTFFSTMLMACCATRQALELERIREEPLKVLWYDTEQSRQSTRNILKKRVAPMVGAAPFPEAQYFVYNVRSCCYQERLEMLVTGISAYRPDLVIIDNISDLLPSINDSEASVQVIDQLLQIASEYSCNVTVVIHLNKSGEKRNLRGWLGTELLHKSFEVFYCERIYNTKVFSVEQTLSRQQEIDPKLYYEVTAEGLPVVTKKPDTTTRDAQGKFTSSRAETYQVSAEKAATFNNEYIIRHPDDAANPWEWDLRRLFTDAMGSRASIDRDDLRRLVMEKAGIRVERYYKKLFELAMDQRVIKTTMDRNGRVVVIIV